MGNPHAGINPYHVWYSQPSFPLGMKNNITSAVCVLSPNHFRTKLTVLLSILLSTFCWMWTLENRCCTLESATCLIASSFIVSGSGHLSIRFILDVNSDKMMFTCSFHSPAILTLMKRIYLYGFCCYCKHWTFIRFWTVPSVPSTPPLIQNSTFCVLNLQTWPFQKSIGSGQHVLNYTLFSGDHQDIICIALYWDRRYQCKVGLYIHLSLCLWTAEVAVFPLMIWSWHREITFQMHLYMTHA